VDQAGDETVMSVSLLQIEIPTLYRGFDATIKDPSKISHHETGYTQIFGKCHGLHEWKPTFGPASVFTVPDPA
jgi:hypothetical protein